MLNLATTANCSNWLAWLVRVNALASSEKKSWNALNLRVRFERFPEASVYSDQRLQPHSWQNEALMAGLRTLFYVLINLPRSVSLSFSRHQWETMSFLLR